jgi:hypothetical protein
MRIPFQITTAFVVFNLILVLPGLASALGIFIANTSSTGKSTSVLAPGDILTIDLVVNNDAALPVYGMGLSVSGYDVDRNAIADDGLQFLDGVGAESVLNGTTIPNPDGLPGLTSFGGLSNFRNPPSEIVGRSRETETSPLVYHGLGVDFMGGVSLTPTDGDGSGDVGIGGRLISEGDVHFRLRFQATPSVVPSEMTLVFGIPLDPWGESGWGSAVVGSGGVLYDFDNDFLDLFNQKLALTVVPEPGTALLLGLGLAALATRRN